MNEQDSERLSKGLYSCTSEEEESNKRVDFHSNCNSATNLNSSPDGGLEEPEHDLFIDCGIPTVEPDSNSDSSESCSSISSSSAVPLDDFACPMESQPSSLIVELPFDDPPWMKADEWAAIRSMGSSSTSNEPQSSSVAPHKSAESMDCDSTTTLLPVTSENSFVSAYQSKKTKNADGSSSINDQRPTKTLRPNPSESVNCTTTGASKISLSWLLGKTPEIPTTDLQQMAPVNTVPASLKSSRQAELLCPTGNVTHFSTRSSEKRSRVARVRPQTPSLNKIPLLDLTNSPPAATASEIQPSSSSTLLRSSIPYEQQHSSNHSLAVKNFDVANSSTFADMNLNSVEAFPTVPPPNVMDPTGSVQNTLTQSQTSHRMSTESLSSTSSLESLNKTNTAAKLSTSPSYLSNMVNVSRVAPLMTGLTSKNATVTEQALNTQTSSSPDSLEVPISGVANQIQASQTVYSRPLIQDIEECNPHQPGIQNDSHTSSSHQTSLTTAASETCENQSPKIAVSSNTFFPPRVLSISASQKSVKNKSSSTVQPVASASASSLDSNKPVPFSSTFNPVTTCLPEPVCLSNSSIHLDANRYDPGLLTASSQLPSSSQSLNSLSILANVEHHSFGQFPAHLQHSTLISQFSHPFISTSSDESVLSAVIARKPVGKLRDLAVRRGKPRPKPAESLQYQGHSPSSNGTYSKQHIFNCEQNVNNIEWLTASFKLKKYYCWPCLLFASRRDIFWSVDMSISNHDASALITALDQHGNQHAHLEAAVLLKIRENCLKPSLPGSSASSGVAPSNIDDRLLKLLFEVIFKLKKRVNNVCSNFDELIGFMRLLSYYDADLRNVSDDSTLEKFVVKNSHFAMDSISSMIKLRILDEVLKAKFIIVIFEDTKHFVDESYVAVVVRYWNKDDTICETFLQFIELGFDRSSWCVLNKVQPILNELKLAKKLIGFTYSATLVEPLQTAVFNYEMTKSYPSAEYFPYIEHTIEKWLFQTLSHVPSCRRFMYTFWSLENFFRSNPKAMTVLRDIGRLLPTVDESAFEVDSPNFSSTLAYVLVHCNRALLVFFEQIVQFKDNWDDEVVCQTEQFLTSLRSVQSQYVLSIVTKLLDCVKDVSAKTSREVIVSEWQYVVKKALAAAKRIRLTGSKDIILALSASVPAESYSFAFLQQHRLDFNASMDMFIFSLHQRFSNLDDAFFDVHSINFDAVTATQPFSSSIVPVRFRSLVQPLDHFLAQMYFIRTDQLFVRGKMSAEALEFIKNHEMTAALDKACTFLKMASLVPRQRSPQPTKISQIHDYVRTNKTISTDDAVIWLERDLLSSMQKDPLFIDNVIHSYKLKNFK